MKRLSLVFLLLGACNEEAPRPLPVALTAESRGYFCQMDMLGHPGPKAQIHLASFPGAPLFFSQVRDAVVYLRLPEQIDTITAIYVSDMGKAASWSDPGAANWIAADKAFYVVGSGAKGGMDAAEFVPFGARVQAIEFATRNGGQVMSLSQLPQSAIETTPGDSDPDYAARLHALTDNGG
jgi:copper chaperone NosL